MSEGLRETFDKKFGDNDLSSDYVAVCWEWFKIGADAQAARITRLETAMRAACVISESQSAWAVQKALRDALEGE